MMLPPWGYKPPTIARPIPNEKAERDALEAAAGAGGRGGAAAKALKSWDAYKAEKTAGVLPFDDEISAREESAA